MRIGMAQINSHLGNFSANADKIIEYTKKALERNCDLVLFPELALFGYWTSDLLERPSIVSAQDKELEKLAKKIPEGIGVLFGAVTHAKKTDIKYFRNSAVFLQKNKKPKYFHKELLPTYEVFDEKRHFAEGELAKNVLKFKGKRLLVSICEDIWGWGEAWEGTRYVNNPFRAVRAEKFDAVLNLSASPFSKAKDERRLSVVQKTAKYMKCPLVYVNMVGGQDELVFDGGSIAVDKKGKIIAESSYFEEDINVADIDSLEGGLRPHNLTSLKKKDKDLEAFRRAIALGIRDFVGKNGMTKVHLGLSGGIDSALVACLAVDALGPGNVTCIALPSEFNHQESYDLAKQLAENLGTKFYSIPIKDPYEAMLNSFEENISKEDFGLMNENLQARIRGTFLMAYSNRHHSMLLTTGNKSEYATGYATLYGDMNGGLAPIGDLLKTEVFALSEYYNKEYELIPKRIIDRPPSAELRPDQKDEDSLPPYKVLDRSIEKIVVECKPATTKVDKEVLKLIYRNEFKRWQAAPIVRVSKHAFGTGRRFPITNAAIL
ncbi:MAG: NAD+ synthase [Bdellovibrionota bacterium]|nr:NAD+ synthase [Bdellovibrionota bacterium]